MTSLVANTAEEKRTPIACPFCGESPLEDRIEPHEHSSALMGLIPIPFRYPGSWSIECVPCGFRIFSHDSREEAIAKWNRRNSFDALTEANKKLVALVERANRMLLSDKGEAAENFRSDVRNILKVSP